MATPRFDATDADRDLIARIVDRTLDLIATYEPVGKRERRDRRINLMMSVTACHMNGNPLDLAKLAAADDFNLMHDVGGIDRHIDHSTGKLLHCFSPRCSAREVEAA